MDSKGLGDIPNNSNRGVLLPSLDPTQIAHIDADLGRELFLT